MEGDGYDDVRGYGNEYWEKYVEGGEYRGGLVEKEGNFIRGKGGGGGMGL